MLERIVCPICKSFVKRHAIFLQNNYILKGELICSNCDRRYLIEDGILNMLPDSLRTKGDIKDSSWGQWKRRLNMFKERMEDWKIEYNINILAIRYFDAQDRLILRQMIKR